MLLKSDLREIGRLVQHLGNPFQLGMEFKNVAAGTVVRDRVEASKFPFLVYGVSGIAIGNSGNLRNDLVMIKLKNLQTEQPFMNDWASLTAIIGPGSAEPMRLSHPWFLTNNKSIEVSIRNDAGETISLCTLTFHGVKLYGDSIPAQLAA
jgi:hypothetical protein